MRPKLNLSRKTLLVVALPLLFELLFVGSLSLLLSQANQKIRLFQEAQRSLSTAQALESAFYRAAATLQTFDRSRNPLSEQLTERAFASLSRRIADLSSISISNPDLRMREAVRSAIKGAELLRQAKDRVDLGGSAFNKVRGEDVAALVGEFSQRLSGFANDQQSRVNQAEYQTTYFNTAVQICLLCGVTLSVLFTIGAAYTFNSGIIKRLNVLAANAKRFANQDELLPPLQGHDELVDLDSIFHEMVRSLSAARESEQRAEQLRQDVLSMVSHDLRTPLMSVQLSLELMSSGKRGELPSTLQQDVNAASRAIDKIVRLANDFLEVQKVDEIVALHPEVCTTTELMEEAANAVRALTLERNVDVEISGPTLEITCDGLRIEQVLVNLISNAIRFSPAFDKVSVVCKKDPGGVKFSVIDHGPGFNPDMAKSLFSKFVQGQNVRSSSPNAHFGVGLYICQSIVNRHGGQLSCETSEHGTHFWFTLPS